MLMCITVTNVDNLIRCKHLLTFVNEFLPQKREPKCFSRDFGIRREMPNFAAEKKSD